MQAVLRGQSDDRGGVIGSGLRAWELAAILCIAIATFLWWGGALWSVPTGSSHVARITVSYALVPPLAALVLLVERRWSWTRLLSATALLWSVKLVITASLYAYLASGSASRYQPEATWEHAPAGAPAASARYRAAETAHYAADVDGVVRRSGAPVAGAIVAVEEPPPGRALDAGREIAVEIRDARYAAGAFTATTRDRIAFMNRDATLHTARVTRDGHAVRNAPLPPGIAAPALTGLPPGWYTLSCQNHATERAALLVVDHPYATVTDGEGRFHLGGVPAGDLHLVVAREGRATAHRTVHVAGARVETAIDLGENE